MPSKHSGYSEGRISKREEKRADGSVRVRWVAELMIGYDSLGKRKMWRASAKTRKEAADFLSKARADVQTDVQTGEQVGSARQPFSQFLNAWLDSISTSGLDRRTYLGYKTIIERHILLDLGHLRLDKLSPQHAQTLYAKKSKELSATTVLHIHRCLHRALEMAVRWRLIARNPTDLVDAPSPERREQSFLSPDEARRFLDAIKGDPWEAYWTLAITTAMRPGELRALKWKDVDFTNSQIRLQRAIRRLPGEGWDEKDTKTHRGQNITLMSFALESLKRHRSLKAEARLALSGRTQATSLLTSAVDQWKRVTSTAGHSSGYLKRPIFQRSVRMICTFRSEPAPVPWYSPESRPGAFRLCSPSTPTLTPCRFFRVRRSASSRSY